jgi:hypothetical protein
MQLFRQTLLVSMLMIFLLLVACSDRQQPAETRGDSVDDLDSLVNRLQAAGATVEPAGTVSQPFFTPRGQVIVVNDQDVQAFEYESQADANAEVALVAPDGSSVGASIMNWMATPHFFNSGKLIVLYVGDQNDTIDVLEALLGTQFAGG